MPELPDVVVYIEHLQRRTVGQPLEGVRLGSPFVLRSADPPLREAFGRKVLGLRRMGKRIVFELEGELFLVIHLMVSGRLHWKERGVKVPGKVGLAAFDFPNGTLTFTEASTKKRASIHLVRGEAALKEFDRGGLEVLGATAEQFAAALRRENHTLKRSLTDPRLFSGIGNAYSDELLHRAGMSPVKLTAQLTDEEAKRLFRATADTLVEWRDKLRAEAGEEFPEKVTAFREEMAVHGRYGKPCPKCGGKVQRIVYAENETNYCPGCQTGGKLLADRSLSRLLKEDWPKTADELEELKAGQRRA
ncbi:MAG TPA: DNA-formamidopyrimidine glycosylase family protein [Myxococcaceae bacterium]|jgi:formamidopyrimidine-DNA glycosylase